MAELSLQQRRAMAMAQARLRMQSSASKGPTSRGRGGNLAEEQAALNARPSLQEPPQQAPPAETRRGVGRPGMFGGLLDAPAELAASAVTGGAASLAAGARNIVGMLSGESPEEAGKTGAQMAADYTYQPRTPEAQAMARGADVVLGAPQRAGNALQDRLTESGNETAGVVANSAIQIVPQALMTALGARSRQSPAQPPQAPATGWAPPAAPKAPSPVANRFQRIVDRFSPGDAGAKRVAGRIVQNEAGTPEMRAALAERLRAEGGKDTFPVQAGGPKKMYAKASRPTSSEIVADMPEGSPIIGLRDYLATKTGADAGSPSTVYGRVIQTQNAAREAAKLNRKALTTPLREKALANANDTTAAILKATDDIESRYASKAAALQDKGRFDTMAAEQTRMSMNKPGPTGPVTDKLGLRPMGKSTPPQATGAASRPPAKYTTQAARAEEAVAASDDVAPIIRQRQAELRAAEAELARLQKDGASPLTIEKATNKINSILTTPGLRASQVVRKSMNAIREHLETLKDKNGVINADDLYTVRKELGNYIEAAAKENSSWDKKLSGGLQRDLQRAFDDAIESSGGTGWKQYLSEYERLSKPIDADLARIEARKSPLQRSQMSPGDQVAAQTSTGIPNMLERNVMIANAIARIAGEKMAPKVTKALMDLEIDPIAMADALERLPASQRRAVVSQLASNRPLSGPMALAVGGAQNQENR